MNRSAAQKIIEQSQAGYDAFAGSFAQTRNWRRADMESLFQNYLKSGAKVLDIGCANGRFYPFFKEKNAVYTGIDNSSQLIAIAQKNYPSAHFQIADALSLPFSENSFDIVAALAILHHIPSKKYQNEFFCQINRALKPSGIAIVTVWDLRLSKILSTRNFKRLSQFLRSRLNPALDFSDFYIPWQNQYQRYVHAFSEKELAALATQSGLAIESVGTLGKSDKESNLYIIAKKVQNNA